MDRADSVLDALSELERRYDGPIPPALRQAARHGSPAAALRWRSAAEIGFFAALARRQIASLRRHRLAPLDGARRRDLDLYLRQWRAWRRLAASLAGQDADGQREAPPMEGGASGFDGSRPSPDPRPGIVSAV
jgi:hypothetical protein